MSLALRLSMAMVCLTAATTLTAGVIVYRQSTAAALPLALDALRSHTALLADDLLGYVDVAREDLLVMAQSPAVREYADEAEKASPVQGWHGAPRQRARAARLLVALVTIKLRYDQLRIIGRHENGREVVRVDRQGPGGAARSVASAALKARAGSPYFEPAFARRGDDVYVSTIAYHREEGGGERPAIPTMRLGKPVLFDGRDPQFILMADVDMRPIFARLSSALPPTSTMYLVDEAGHYLIDGKHRDEVTGNETGPVGRIQDELGGIAPLLASTKPAVLALQDADGRPMAAASWPVLLVGAQRVTILELAPIAELMAPTNASIARAILAVGSVAGVLAALVAVTVSYRVSHPLRSIADALVDVTRGRPVSLPVRATGEIGALARGVAQYLERESLLGALVSSSIDAVLTKTLDGTITSWNPAAAALYGYSADEAIGANIKMLTPVDRRAELEEIMQGLARGDSLHAYQTVGIDKSGKRLDVSLTISPIRSPAGVVVGGSTIARDITRTLADARQLRKLQAETAHAARVDTAGQMAATLAHELNQPLTAMINYVRSVQRTLEDRGRPEDDKVISYAQKAMEQSRRAADIVRKVSTFIGNKQSNVCHQMINPVVEQGLELALLGAGKQSVIVTRDYAEGLPSVSIDEVQIGQVVANLARNALEAMASVSDARLTIRTAASDGTVVVTISDTGTGFDASIRDHLFEPFITNKPGGMGFGLNICRSLIEAHGGTLMAEESVEGTIFRFTLPAAQG
ncbi:hypothetical protein Sa4125_39220 [Aureimonas sp. SA4125]|uniref:two-component system sensor histidine kinase NtrB n=1 Tax=Aureimonas sp. SA4125 TaxID=2826993 RepID=UPI001CC6A9AC|nr:ATP-binding protein [Aureimonas sp. SA4125]BDA86380.1 hypothetical protein Sa4125_39220 [Aureimonas sp. SA4125]